MLQSFLEGMEGVRYWIAPLNLSYAAKKPFSLAPAEEAKGRDFPLYHQRLRPATEPLLCRTQKRYSCVQ